MLSSPLQARRKTAHADSRREKSRERRGRGESIYTIYTVYLCASFLIKIILLLMMMDDDALLVYL